MSTFNPFRANPLSPASTGASINTVTSFNPPPSFHSVARDDETTVHFDTFDELPVISEDAEEGIEGGGGSELLRTGTMMTSMTLRTTGTAEEATRTPTQSPLIDLHSLPSTPRLSPTTEISIQVHDEEPPLPPLPLSRNTTSSSSRTRNDDSDFLLAPVYPEEPPPGYTLTADVNHGEATLQVGPRRPFQRLPPPQATPVPPGPPETPPGSRRPFQRLPPRATPVTLEPPPGPPETPSNADYTPPPPVPSTSPNLSPFSSLNRGRHGRWGVLQQWRNQVFDQMEQISNSAGVGTSTSMNNTPPSQEQGQLPTPRHVRSVSELGPRTGRRSGNVSPPRRLSPTPSVPELGPRIGRNLTPPPLPPRQLSPIPTGGSSTSIDTVNTVNSRNSAPASTSNSSSIPSSARSDFARDFYAAGTGEELLNLDLSADRAGSGASAPNGPSSSRPSASSSTMSNGGTDDDKPTSRPVPGHPLLNDGKILIYPKGFSCPKCFNIGYKRSDPSQPCKKCWKKYAKPYFPAMSATFEGGASTTTTTTFQRPLPKPAASTPSVPGTTTAQNLNARPTTLRRPATNSSLRRPTPSVPNLHAAAAAASSSSSLNLGGYTPSPMGGCAHPCHSPSGSYIQPLQMQQTGLAGGGVGGGGRGVSMYSAGDPRLGGRWCWHCSGTGRVRGFMFDSSLCMVCSGIGRVYGGGY